MTTWRLIKDDISEPCMHFAMEEAIIRCVDEGKSPNTLRIRRVEPSVWIGVYQDPREDVDIKYCQENGIRIIRRLNPGGAVYQDFGTFCYSAFFRKSFFNDFKKIPSDDLYGIFGTIVIETFSEFGIQANIAPVNDISVGKRKIYGSAQLDWYSSFVHSGSFLFQVDKAVMQRSLRPSNLKFIDKGFDNVRDRVVNFSELADGNVTIDQVMNTFIMKFVSVLKVDLKESGISEDEMNLAEELYDVKYSDDNWTFSTQKNYSTVLSTKIKSGVLLLSLSIEGDKLNDLSVSGDFLIANQKDLSNYISSIKNMTLDKALQKTRSALLPADLREGIYDLLIDFQNSRSHG